MACNIHVPDLSSLNITEVPVLCDGLDKIKLIEASQSNQENPSVKTNNSIPVLGIGKILSNNQTIEPELEEQRVKKKRNRHRKKKQQKEYIQRNETEKNIPDENSSQMGSSVPTCHSKNVIQRKNVELNKKEHKTKENVREDLRTNQPSASSKEKRPDSSCSQGTSKSKKDHKRRERKGDCVDDTETKQKTSHSSLHYEGPRPKDARTPNHISTPKGSSNRKPYYEKYWSEKDIEEGEKNGILITGAIRFNVRNLAEAYITHPDGHADVVISSYTDKNRAFNGDLVAVKINGRKDWQVRKSSLKILVKDNNTGNKSDSDSDPDVIVEEEYPSEGEEAAAIAKNSELLVDSKCDTPLKKKKVENDNCSLGDMLSDHSLHPDIMAVLKDLVVEDKIIENWDFVDNCVRRTGKVVGILEQKHSRTCTGHLLPNNMKDALFQPVDGKRVMRIFIPISDCPKDFLERPDDHKTALFVAKITDWPVNSKFPRGQLVKHLGESGQIEPETEGILLEYGVDNSDFGEESLDSLPTKTLPWRIPSEEYDSRRDFRNTCVFTIDPATARDLDDAMSCEQLEDGTYEIGVHIADVSYFVKEGTKLDLIASQRSTSVYLVQKVVPMLPRILCEELCSLNPDTDRLTFSVVWNVSEDGDIHAEWFGRSVIKSCCKLSYDHAQGFIEKPEKDWTVSEIPPISENFSVKDIKARVLTLDKIAKKLKQKRFDQGALRLDQTKISFTLDDTTGMPNGYKVYERKDSNSLIEEFMLLANIAVAHKINRAFADTALLRRHPPPSNKMLNDLESLMRHLGVPVDVHDSGSLQKSLSKYQGVDDFTKARMQVIVNMCSKPMQNAEYFCNGCIDDEGEYRHYALSVPIYTHFTSPIRRYPDILVHRALAGSLGYSDYKYNKDKLQKQAINSNDKKYISKQVQELSADLYLAVFIKEVGPLEMEGMVMGVLDQCFEVFLLGMGVNKRVYCDKLPNLSNVEYVKDHMVPVLTLTWGKTEERREKIKQTITIFTKVKCVLMKGDLPLSWMAIIEPPYSAGNSSD